MPKQDPSAGGEDQPLHVLGLRESSRRIIDGEITAESFVRALIARIEALEPDIQAWEWLDAGRAVAAARLADLRRARGVPSDDPARVLPFEEQGLLPGVPIAVKDIVDVAGMPTRMGSPVYRDHWPHDSARTWTSLTESGAVAMGKTVTTEFAFMVPNKTRNPWNTAHTPGGSSSGSAAAVACGMVPGAIGTQTNGSIIRPAAFCGVVGFKPCVGEVATEGVLPFSGTLDTPGVFTRSVEDAALLASWMTRAKGTIARRIASLKAAPRLVAVRSPVWEKAEPDQRRQFAEDIEVLRQSGATVDERELPVAFGRAHAVHRTVMLFEAAAGSRPIREKWDALFSPFLAAALEEGDRITEAEYRKALATRRALIAAFAAFVDDRYAGVITPPAPGEAPATLEATGDPAFCTLWTLLGVPSISIPTGLGSRGMPLGLQIVGRPHESNTLLAVAAWCEARRPFPGLV